MAAISNKKNILITLFCVALSTLSIAHFIKKNYEGLDTKPIDFLIFAGTGKRFHETGQLYKRVEDYPDRYHPSAAIYKFPPPFQLAFSPWYADGKPKHFHVYARIMMVSMYVLTILLLFNYLRKSYRLDSSQQLILITFMLTVSCWFMPYYECIDWLLTEIPMLFIFVISFLVLQRNAMLSGALMAYTACIKIYPAFLLSYFLLVNKQKVLIGSILSTVITLALSVWYFGVEEHVFYVKTILPVLLSEPVIDKWINLNLEKFLYAIGLVNQVDGSLFKLLRTALLGVTFYLIYRHYRLLPEKPYLLFSFLVCTMFFCFPNYWPQYQIYLLIPFAGLAAEYISQQKKQLLFLLFIIFLPLCVDDLLWQQIIDTQFGEQKKDPAFIASISKEIEQNGLGTTMLHYNPKAWLSLYLYEMRALAALSLWGLLIIQLRSANQRTARDLETTS